MAWWAVLGGEGEKGKDPSPCCSSSAGICWTAHTAGTNSHLIREGDVSAHDNSAPHGTMKFQAIMEKYNGLCWPNLTAR